MVWLVVDSHHKYSTACFLWGVFTTKEKALDVVKEYDLIAEDDIFKLELDKVCQDFKPKKSWGWRIPVKPI